ncbi:MAG: hypothetical protein GXN98_02725 [Euryarchaeota archaeon]|nr:hypothetical protein [Euryarchaeota archaeon]
MAECTSCCRCSEVCIAFKLGAVEHAPVHRRREVFTCTACWRCARACPEGVDIYRECMLARRRQGLPESYRRALLRLLSSGIAVPAGDVNALREMHGLGKVRLLSSGELKKLLPGVERQLRR